MKDFTIANAAGFWGDMLDAPENLLQDSAPNYITLEYLAELTMGILGILKAKDAQAGFVHELPKVLGKLAKTPHFLKTKFVSNGGGLNVNGCGLECLKVLKEAGVKKYKIGLVSGDDLLNLYTKEELGKVLKPLGQQVSFESIQSKILSANAYLGAEGIKDALALGADLVITGRVADASLILGPCLHELKWKLDDFDSLSLGTIVGHIIECGAQCCGGNFSGNRDFSLDFPGYPIAKISDKEALIYKSKGDGRVNFHTVAEQLVYEIGDPKRYLTPDVIADFTSIELSEVGQDQVSIKKAKGIKYPDDFKVTVIYKDGYKISSQLVVFGVGALGRAQEASSIIEKRAKKLGLPLDIYTEYLGAGSSVPGKLNTQAEEIVLRMTAKSFEKDALITFSRLFAPLVTNGPNGISGYTGGLPSPIGNLGIWSGLINRDLVHYKVDELSL